MKILVSNQLIINSMTCYATDRINHIKQNIFNNLPNELIINIMKHMGPVTLLYMEYLDPNFKYFSRMLPVSYFINFTKYTDDYNQVVKELAILSNERIIEKTCSIFHNLYNHFKSEFGPNKLMPTPEQVVELLAFKKKMINFGNNIFYQMVLNDNIEGCIMMLSLNYLYINYETIIYEILELNKPNVLEQVVRAGIALNKSFSAFNYYGNNVVKQYDSAEVMQKYIELSNEFPDHMYFDIDIFLRTTLNYGKVNCMQVALNNGANFQEYEWEDPEDYMNKSDSIIHAILGNNMTCIRTMFELVEIFELNDWKSYISFASVHGTVEIIEYIISKESNIINEYENIYNEILKYALCNANINVVQYALNNGAVYSDDMLEFVNDYNETRSEEPLELDEDFDNFHYKRDKLPAHFQEKLNNCIALCNTQ